MTRHKATQMELTVRLLCFGLESCKATGHSGYRLIQVRNLCLADKDFLKENKEIKLLLNEHRLLGRKKKTSGAPGGPANRRRH